MTDVQAPPSPQSVPRPEQPEPVATEDRPAVLVVGPRADARGGIGSVQFVLEQHAGALADLEVVTTHRDGSVRTRLWAMAGGTARAARRIVVGRPAVAHMHVSQRASVLRKGLLGLLARSRGVPVVMHLHGSEFLDWFDGLSRPARGVVRALLRPHRLVVLSETLCGSYRTRLGVPDDHVVALPNPVEWPEVLPPPDLDGEVLALFLGRFGARKGILRPRRRLRPARPRRAPSTAPGRRR